MEKKESTLAEEKTLLEVILQYLIIILNYKKLVVIVSGIAMVGVVIFSYISILLPPAISPLPNIYRARAVLIFQDTSAGNGGVGSILSTFGLDSSIGNGTSDPSTVALQVLSSRPFIDTVVEEFDIINKYNISDNAKTKSRRIISDNSEYFFDTTSGTLTISYTDTDPEFTAKIVNYEVNLLESWFQKEGLSIRARQLSLLEEKLVDIENEIVKIENEIELFQLKNGALDISQIASAQSAILLDLRSTLNQIELEISQYSEYSTIEDPALDILKTKRNNLIYQIKRVEQGYLSSDGRKMPATEELPELSLAFTRMQADLSLQMQLYQTLSERYEVTKLSTAEDNIFSVLEYAEIPDEKQGPIRGKICIIVSIGAFFASIVLVLAIHAIKGILSDPKYIAILKGKKKK